MINESNKASIDKKRAIVLHVCCGPCATYPAVFLANEYRIIGYFYNPNIFPYAEWLKRFLAFKKFCENSDAIADYFPQNPLSGKEYGDEHQRYLEAIKGSEDEPEGGARCLACFRLRLEESARFVKELGMEIFTTTLTIGRNKRPEAINPIGNAAAKRYSLKFFEADWKKQDGIKRACEIARGHGLYRQNYCGCEFSP